LDNDSFQPWLARTARELRQARGLKLLDIATRAGVAENTVHRFERWPGWRRDTDLIVAAYAHELGVEPAEVWAAALDSWRSSR
jgi:lambda repressor-like predicted transcriptional regulator